MHDTTPTTPPPLLRLNAAARKAGIGPKTLRALIRGGEGPRAIRPSKRWIMISPDDLDAWLSTRSLPAATVSA